MTAEDGSDRRAVIHGLQTISLILYLMTHLQGMGRVLGEIIGSRI